MHIPCELYTGKNTSRLLTLYVDGGRIYFFDQQTPIFVQDLGRISLKLNSAQDLLRLEYQDSIYYFYSKQMHLLTEMLAGTRNLNFKLSARYGLGFKAKPVELTMFDDFFCVENLPVRYVDVISCYVSDNRVSILCPALGEQSFAFLSLHAAQQFGAMLSLLDCSTFAEARVKCEVSMAIAEDTDLEAIVV